jgi:hypothetical protein
MHIKQNEGALEGKMPRTFDFTTMYTQLPHQKIFSNVEKAVDEAIVYLRNTGKTHPLLYKKALIMKYLRFVVKNTYFGNNPNDIRQQMVGIPMGTNSAPEIANLTLYVDEAQFIDSLGRLEEKRRYCFTKRYIDDSILFDTTPPPENIYGLQYSEQTHEDGSVNFLGAKIVSKDNKIIMSVFDKTKEWKFFPVLRYCRIPMARTQFAASFNPLEETITTFSFVGLPIVKKPFKKIRHHHLIFKEYFRLILNKTLLLHH